jgi:hypothetical protein
MMMLTLQRHKPAGRLVLALAGALFLVSGVFVLMQVPWVSLASPPVEGNSLSFGGGTPVFTPAQNVTALTAAYLDKDAFPDLVFAAGGDVRIAANTGFPFTGWLAPVVVASGLGRVNEVLAVDVDRDTRTDIVAICGDAGNGQVLLWRNPGDPFDTTWSEGGTITQSTVVTYSAGAVGDLDGDAAPDLVVGGSDGVLRLWRNPMAPGGSFTTDWGAPVEIAVAVGLLPAVGVTDLNRDSRLDLLSLVASNLQAWENPGNPFGTLWTTSHTLIGQGSDLRSLSVADFDGDGRPDPAAGDAAGNLMVWSNPLTPGLPFDGGWPSPAVLGTAGEPVLSLIAGDFDHDGWVDLAAGGGGPMRAVRAWRNDRTLTGVWGAVTLGTRGDAVYALATVDADTDGDPDILSGSGASDTAQVTWWPNTLIHRNAPFPGGVLPVGESASGMSALVQGDLDLDGWPDLVSGSATGEIVIWKNNGNPMQGVWASHVVSDAHDLMSLALGDLDEDGDLEIVSGHTSPPRLLVWHNVSASGGGPSLDGPWVSSVIGDPGAGVGGLAVADVDLDGWPDLVSGSGVHLDSPSPNHKVTLWHGDSTPFDGPWSFADAAVISYSVNAVAVGDLDLDGWPDISIGTDHAPAMGSADDPVARALWTDAFQVQALRNPGTPFSTPWPVTVVGRDPTTVTLGPEEDPSHYHGFWGASVLDVKLADFDRDGDLDIVTADDIYADYQVKVWENDGTPFDGQPEAFHWTWQPVTVWYGQPPSPPWMGGSALTVDVADFNLDGWPDVVPGITSWIWVWFQNTGQPFGDYITDTQWIRRASGVSSVDVRAVAAGDYDRDGDPDVACGTNLVAGPEAGLWPNPGGIVAETASATGSSPMSHGATDDLLRIRVKHNGYSGEEGVRLSRWRVRITGPGGSPLTSAEANALIDTLWVYRDTGNGWWSESDSLMMTVTNLALDSSGYQTLLFGGSDPQTVVPATGTASFFVVVRITDRAVYQTPNAFQVWFDADADSLVRGVTSGASVAVEDTQPIGSGVIQLVGTDQVLIEDAPGGTGSEIGDAVVVSGYGLDLYATHRDGLGQYVADQSVTWTLTPLGGGVVPADLIPSADGTSARLHGHLTGTARISIAHATLGSDATGLITVVPGPAHMLLSVDPPDVVIGEATTATLRARLQDAGGAPVVDTVPVTFTVVSGGGLGTLPADPYVASTVGGQATAVFTAGTQTGQVIISAATGGLVEQVSVTLRPGPLAAFEISDYSTSTYAGSGLQQGPRLTVLDGHGNVKTDYTGSVYFLTSDPQAMVSVTVDTPYAFAVEDQGVHAFDGAGFVLGTVGTQVITVTDGVLAAATSPIEVRPGVAVGSIELSLSNQVITAGLPVTCAVEAFDVYGNSMGDWTPWCDYSIEEEAKGQWAGNVYTSEVDGTWYIVASTGGASGPSDVVELRVLFGGHRIYLPSVMR